MKTFFRTILILFLFFSIFIPYLQPKSVQAATLAKPINLGFKPYDTVIDPIKPVIYMTYKGSRTIYSVNYSTGEIKTLVLPYTAERLAIFKNLLYVTQLKTNHDYSSEKSIIGAFAVVDTENFSLKKVIDVNTDPYDIAVDENGFVYLTPGSSQYGPLKVYSIEKGEEINNTSVNTDMYGKSNLYYNQQMSKLYSISSDISPRNVTGFEVNNGLIVSYYNSPYHGDFVLFPDAKITPDGVSMYNNSGVVFNLQKTQSGDMNYAFSLGRIYVDYEFSIENQLTFAVRQDAGIDVYKYGSNEYLYTICKDLLILKLHYQNGQLLAIYTDGNGNYYAASIDANTPGTTDVPLPPTAPVSPRDIDFLYAQSFIDSGNLGRAYYNTDLLDGGQDVGLDSTFNIFFNQSYIFNDHTKISIVGPKGPVEVSCQGSNNVLSLVPKLLSPDTTYTLTIKKGALFGYQGKPMSNDIVMTFKTGTFWRQSNGKWFFYYNKYTTKHYLIGWQTISGIRYYFNTAGDMQIGWKSINSNWYYFDSSGKMKSGWQQIGKYWYYFDSNGIMKTGWVSLNKKWYYLNPNGDMKIGWLYYMNNWYFLDKSGCMATGWIYDGGKWYYLYSNGIMAHDTMIGKYRLGHDGVWIK